MSSFLLKSRYRPENTGPLVFPCQKRSCRKSHKPATWPFSLSTKGQLISKCPKTKLSSCNFCQKINQRIFFSILTTRKYVGTWNLNFDFKFQVFPSRQDRKTNSSVHFLGEIMAWQFFFKILWPLRCWVLINNKQFLFKLFHKSYNNNSILVED